MLPAETEKLDPWRALAAASAGQEAAIAAGDEDRLDALLDEKDRLLAVLSTRDALADTKQDPSLLAVIREIQVQEVAAEVALEASMAQLFAQLANVRARHTVRKAFLTSRGFLPAGTPAPRFLDQQS